MTFRVLIADSLPAAGIEAFSMQAALDVDDRVGIDRETLAAELPNYDALVVRSRTKVDADLIATGTRLQVIGRAGIGVDNIDVSAATRAGVAVMNTPDGNATTTAEHTIAMMMSMVRQVPQATASMKGGRWEKKRFMGRELSGKTLGIVGLGNIGRIVASRAQGLNMKVIAHDPFFKEEAARKLGVEPVAFDELLRRADLVSVHTPLNDGTRGLIGAAEIDRMKQGVMVINCARGGIYDEAALLAGLESGRIAAAALDVFVSEPPAEDDPLVKHDRVICTPHLGASTTEAQVQVAIDIAEQLGEFAAGGPARNAINLPRISAAELRQLGPYLSLADRMGAFVGQLGGGRIVGFEVTLAGEIATRDVQAVGTSALAGALQHAFSRPVNAVNARVLAEERGIRVTESRESRPQQNYASTVRVLARGAEGDEQVVVGTVFGDEEGRFVEVNGVALEAVPAGCLLLIANRDCPGVVGHIGSILGTAGINISRMHLGLDRQSGDALSIVSVDRPLTGEVIEELSSGDVVSVRQVEL